MMNFIPDAELTEAEFINKYTIGSESIGNSEEIKNYLRLRHQYFTKKITSYHLVMEAYEKTGLKR